MVSREVFDFPCALHRGVRADEIGQPPGPVLVLMVRGADRPEGLADLPPGVSEQPELEVLPFAESLLGLGGVVGDAEDLRSGLVEF